MSNPVVRSTPVEHSLALIAAAENALEQAQSIEEVLDLRDKAQAFATLARLAEAHFELEQRATLLRIRAERKAGELLPSIIQHGGDPRSRATTLDGIGLTKSQSYRWQTIASIPEPKFNAWLDEKMAAGHDLSTAGLIRYAQNLSPNGHMPGVSLNLITLNPGRHICALRGYLIACAGNLQGHHIIPKQWARGNEDVRALLAECPDEIMAHVCEAHNVGKYADAPEARRILLLQKVWAYGLAHMRQFLADLPWKVPAYERTLEGILK